MEKQLKDFLPESELFKINVRTNPKMGESFHVRQTPLMLILQNGKEIWRQEKVISESGLLHYLGLKNSQQENELREN